MRERQPIREGPLLAVLAAVQFTTMLDFLIMMPLGPQYMRVFSITAGQFGTIVSSYAIAAGVAGLLCGTWLDRLDRRTALLSLYTGFAASTLLCALAPGHVALTAARALAGAFGGVSNAVILAIIGDVIPEERRGRAMGLVMSSFSLASVVGVPTGLWLATAFSWHAPFFMLAAASALVLSAAHFFTPAIRGNLPRRESVVAHLQRLMRGPGHLRAFAFIGCVTLAGFLIIPYISPFMVRNVGLKESELPYIYLIGGAFTIFSMNIVGRLSDRYGKRRLFALMVLLAIGATLLLTHLPRVTTPAALSATTIFMICMSGRFVPAMAIMSSVVNRQMRAGFMSVSSATQHLASGLGSYLGGLVLTESAAGCLRHYGTLGWISAAIAIAALWICITLPPGATDSDPAAGHLEAVG